MKRITVTASTIGQQNPSQVSLSGGYRYRGDRNWPEDRSAYQAESAPGRRKTAASGGAVNAEGRQKRLREFTGLRAEGVGVFEAGARVGVKQRAARRYEQQRLAAIREAQEHA